MKQTQTTITAGASGQQNRAMAMLDAMFAPDIRVQVSNNIITAAEAVTPEGAQFLMAYPIFGADYDRALSQANGLTFESA